MPVTILGGGTYLATHSWQHAPTTRDEVFMAVNASGQSRVTSTRRGVPNAVYNVRQSCVTIGLSVVALLVLLFALILY